MIQPCFVCGAEDGAPCTPSCEDPQVPDDRVARWAEFTPKSRCARCQCEMSSTLDAYYGRYPENGYFCVRCRTLLKLS